MSRDRLDFANEVEQQLAGLPPAFFTVLLNPSSGGPNGSQMKLNTEYEIAINPCDHLWLPTFFDPSIARNPGQASPGSNGSLPYQGPQFANPQENTGGLGMNVFDVTDQSNQNGYWSQRAPIFSLRFNSLNAPWLLWGCGTNLSLDVANPQASGCGALVGQGDMMRSISGPISRLWVKYLAWTILQGNADIPSSQVVLMSSLGFKQQTVGFSQTAASVAEVPNSFDPATGNALAATYPQLAVNAGGYSISGGGYVQTNVSTLERIKLEEKNLGVARRPDGRG